MFCLASEKMSVLKGENLLPMGANSLLLEQTSFQKALDAQERTQGVTKVIHKNRQSIPVPLTFRNLLAELTDNYLSMLFRISYSSNEIK